MGEGAQLAIELGWLVIWMVLVRKVTRWRFVRRIGTFAAWTFGAALFVTWRTTVGLLRAGR